MMFHVAAFYHFNRFERFADVRSELRQLCETQGVKGTILLAAEGINATIAGSADGVSGVLTHIRALPGFAKLEHKLSFADTMPFKRLKVRLKREIVTMGVPDIDPLRIVGTYVEPRDWNQLIADPNVVVIDTRNDFEVAMGSFDGAVDPQTKSFGEFPRWLDSQREALRGKTLAMFCTGGIRCEKATAYAKSNGFEDVYHLKGGILKYLEEMPREESAWRGDCFVFDERVGLGHGLEISSARGLRPDLDDDLD